MKKYFRLGAYPTMITPYTKDGEVDYETAKKYVQWYHENGCDGIFAVCQSSEIVHLSLGERVQLNRTVYEEACRLAEDGGSRMTIVSSGHVSGSLQEQADELNQIAESGTDALILITNRLDPDNLGDDVWIKNCEKLLGMLPENIPLGLYECPHPYKRLVTPKILKWCLDTGRFYFMKDTCCDSRIIKERLDILKDSHFKLLNANCQTLLQSLKDGGAGYCGIMCNYHPRLYVWMCKNYLEQPEKAEQLQSFLGTAGFTESGLPYPLTAKYHMCLEGIQTELTSRARRAGELTDYAKDCVAQMKQMTDCLIEHL